MQNLYCKLDAEDHFSSCLIASYLMTLCFCFCRYYINVLHVFRLCFLYRVVILWDNTFPSLCLWLLKLYWMEQLLPNVKWLLLLLVRLCRALGMWHVSYVALWSVMCFNLLIKKWEMCSICTMCSCHVEIHCNDEMCCLGFNCLVICFKLLSLFFFLSTNLFHLSADLLLLVVVQIHMTTWRC